MRKLTLYYIETDMGCGIRKAYNMQQAKKNLLKEAGTYVRPKIRKATQDDIAWVKSMGGRT